MSQPRPEDQQKLWLGQALSCNGDGHLAAMGNEDGIEEVTGLRLGSGYGHGSGCECWLGYQLPYWFISIKVHWL